MYLQREEKKKKKNFPLFCFKIVEYSTDKCCNHVSQILYRKELDMIFLVDSAESFIFFLIFFFCLYIFLESHFKKISNTIDQGAHCHLTSCKFYKLEPETWSLSFLTKFFFNEWFANEIISLWILVAYSNDISIDIPLHRISNNISFDLLAFFYREKIQHYIVSKTRWTKFVLSKISTLISCSTHRIT